MRAEGGGQIPNTQFVIPPNHPNFEVTAQRVIDRDTYLTNVYPHMHVRGKDVKYHADHPDGREETILSVPQLRLQLADQLSPGRAEVHAEGIDPEGHRPLRQLEGEPLQPGSREEVRWGDQTWEEMLIGYYSTADAPAPRVNSTNQQQQ